MGLAGRQQAHDGRHRHAQASNAGLASHDRGIEGDDLVRFHPDGLLPACWRRRPQSIGWSASWRFSARPLLEIRTPREVPGDE